MPLKKSELYSHLWASCDELRGGMDASQYKDYVLVLLFVKYVSDKAASQKSYLLDVPKGGSFADIVKLKGDKEIGDKMNKIISKLAEANDLKGVIDVADFNDTDKLGKGKDMVDRLSNLVGIFEDLNFEANRAEGDDLMGDAYEYLMSHFAIESGKSKGQFLTPSEVSRIMAKVIGLGRAKSASQSVHDPTCGSASLLIKAHDEAKNATGFDLALYGQEMDNATAALARMNMILHDCPTAEIWKDNTLACPHFKAPDGSLKTFDFVVANFPFSTKAWSNGLNPPEDEFKRFEFGIPPEKNGDYAFLLHILGCLKSTGKGAVIHPHGVLFRGGAEASIRKEILRRGFIKGIIGLPPNLFYGTGIPACILVLDKENAHARKGIFMIDASKGFVKDGNKNRLRAQDIHRIVDTFNRQIEIDGYSRMVPIAEISDPKNDFNLNLPRYIDNSEPEDLQDIAGHLRGGIPDRDLDALKNYWQVFPSARPLLFESAGRPGYSRLKCPVADLKAKIFSHPEFTAFNASITALFAKWRKAHTPLLDSIAIGDKPKALIEKLSEDLLETFEKARLLDAYDGYQHLMDYWTENMQDDVYMLVSDGWLDAAKPRLIVEDKKTKEAAAIGQQLEEMAEEHGGEEGLLAEAKNEKDKITRASVTARLKEIKGQAESVDELKVLKDYLALIEKETEANDRVKEAQKDLEAKVAAKYGKLSEDEIKTLVADDKWLTTLAAAVQSELDRVSQALTGRIKQLAERYATPLPQVTKDVDALAARVNGSGKSLIMVWLAKWIREHVTDARVLIITDREELDEQIHERVFLPVGEAIYRTKSGADLIAKLNAAQPWLLCSLIHKFGGKEEGEEVGDIPSYIAEVKKALPPGFAAKGDLYVFVDECHRTQSGDLHKAMKAILPNAVFIGFTGTPLLKADKKKSIEIFGRYIHTYKFDEAVKDKVILDLRYEARDIDQSITSQHKIDQWFEAKTKGLTDLAKAQLKKRWGTMQKVLSCQDRLEKIVADILMDMETKDRLASGKGNALLISGSIYEACKFFELFDKTDLHGKCAIVTSYTLSTEDLKGEESGEGETENLQKYAIYQKMLADWFDEAPEKAVKRAEEFEKTVKQKFIKEPGQMKLLIVVDKLLTGFDAPPATYLYIDKPMQDHGLFQAICRVNRLDGEDKTYGYIIDYKDLFKSLEGAVHDYTSGALDGYDKDDVAGLLKDRLKEAREQLDEALEAVRALCEPVQAPRDTAAYLRYFCAKDSGNAEQLKANEPNRLALYKHVAALVRAFADLANELPEAGYSPADISGLRTEVDHYEKVRNEVKLASGDYIDLKMYEPAMRHLIDTYIRAEESEKVSAFDDLSLVQLIIERGPDAVKSLPEGIRKNKEAVAEAIENNVRRLIIDEQPINPKYYEKMSELLDALIEQRRQQALDYQEYLAKIVDLTRKVKNPAAGGSYPSTMNTPARRALYDNLGKNEALALQVDQAVHAASQDDWRSNSFKVKKLRGAIKIALQMHKPQGGASAVPLRESYKGKSGDPEDELVEEVLNLVKNQDEY